MELLDKSCLMIYNKTLQTRGELPKQGLMSQVRIQQQEKSFGLRVFGR